MEETMIGWIVLAAFFLGSFEPLEKIRMGTSPHREGVTKRELY